MSRRRHRNRDNAGLGSVVDDAVHVAARFGPVGALAVGTTGFVCFYAAVPLAIVAWIDATKSKLSGPAAAAFAGALDQIVLQRFVEPCQWAGIAILVACAVIALWKCATGKEPTDSELVGTSMLAKLVARLL